jgi:5-methylcytosine-specific restriction endonuclease McrA
VSEDTLYKKNSRIARDRDGNVCRVCRRTWGLTTHHVKRRSGFGSKQVESKHDVANLYTACVDCHQLFTDNILRAVSTTEAGTDGPVLLERWDDTAKGFVTFTEAS